MLYESCHLIIQTSTWSRFRLEKIKEYCEPSTAGYELWLLVQDPTGVGLLGLGFFLEKVVTKFYRQMKLTWKMYKIHDLTVFRGIFTKVKFEENLLILNGKKSVFVLCEFFSGLWENNHSPRPRHIWSRPYKAFDYLSH